MNEDIRDSFIEFFNNFVKYAKVLNELTLKRFEHKEISFASKEMLSFIVCECLIEDMTIIDELKENGHSRRYVDSIIRNMCEQVIEYKYIMKYQDLLKEYFGQNLSENWEGTNLFKGLKRTGEARFKDRKTVAEMARSIDEYKSNDEKSSLYDIYSLKAEYEHHSYFHYLFELINKNDGDETADDLDYVFMIYVLSSFEKTYIDVLK